MSVVVEWVAAIKRILPDTDTSKADAGLFVLMLGAFMMAPPPPADASVMKKCVDSVFVIMMMLCWTTWTFHRDKIMLYLGCMIWLVWVLTEPWHRHKDALIYDMSVVEWVAAIEKELDEAYTHDNVVRRVQERGRRRVVDAYGSMQAPTTTDTLNAIWGGSQEPLPTHTLQLTASACVIRVCMVLQTRGVSIKGSVPDWVGGSVECVLEQMMTVVPARK